MEEWTYSTSSCIVCSVGPIFFPSLGSLRQSDPIGNGSPCKHAITHEASLFGIWNEYQDAFCERGKFELKKYVRLVEA